MPIYDYVCGACRHRFEVFHGLNETGPHQCPLCEGPVTRAFAPPTIVFKGSGWAKMDRRATSAPAKATRSEKDGPGSPAPTGGTSGAAPAAGSTSGSTSGATATGSTTGSSSGPAAD
jgi:putative FmdB family regulatory protein